MVLDREDRLADEAQSAIGAVKQRDMGLLDAVRQGLGIDRKSMIHGYDLDLSGGEILYRMVGAVVALMHLFRFCTKRETQHLVAKANAEDRQAAVDQFVDDRDRIFAGRGRIARAVGQEHAIRRHRYDVLGTGGCRNDRDLAIEAGEQAQNVALHTVVDADNMVFCILRLEVRAFLIPDPWLFGPLRRLAGRGNLCEVETFQSAPGLGFRLQCVDVEDAVRVMGDDSVGSAVLADPCGERAGIDATKADYAAGLQPGIEILDRAIVGRLGDIGLEDHTDGAVAGGGCQILDIVVVGTDIADMGEGEGDDLSEIGRIGEDFLIAGERGVETHFRLHLAGCAYAGALDHSAIGENEQGGRFCGCPGS